MSNIDPGGHTLGCQTSNPVSIASNATLPMPIVRFIGRNRELQAIDRLVGQGISVIELTDTPGTVAMGKSALAIQAVQRLQARHADYQLYANLYAQDTFPAHARDVLQEWLVLQFGFDPRTLPQRTSELQALYQQQVAGKRVIVVLDNVATLAQVQLLLAQNVATPPAAYVVLITSRSPILSAEQGKTLFVNRLESEASQCFFVDDQTHIGAVASHDLDALAAMLDDEADVAVSSVSADSSSVETDELDDLSALLGDELSVALSPPACIDQISALLDETVVLESDDIAAALDTEALVSPLAIDKSLKQIIKLADGSPFVLNLLSQSLKRDLGQSSEALMLALERNKRQYQEHYAENLAQFMGCLNAVYQQLTVEERDLLSRLSVLHSGQFNATLAAHLAGQTDQATIDATLTSLYERGWLIAMPNLVHPGQIAEYRMPDVARAFLWKKVTAKARRTLVSWALKWQDGDRHEIDRRMAACESAAIAA